METAERRTHIKNWQVSRWRTALGHPDYPAEKIDARGRARYLANRDKIKAQVAAYRAANAEKLKAKRAVYYAANRKQIRARRAAKKAAK